MKTSARPNSEVDDEEISARFPVVVVLFVVVMAFVLVSTRAGVIAMALGFALLAAHHLYQSSRT